MLHARHICIYTNIYAHTFLTLVTGVEWYKMSKFPAISVLLNTDISCISVHADSDSFHNLAFHTSHT